MLYPDNIVHICIQEPFLISKKFMVFPHTLSAYNRLLVRFKVYSSDPRECFCTSAGFPQLLETPQISSIFIFLLESPRISSENLQINDFLLESPRFFFKVHNIFPWYLVSGSIKFKTLIVHVYSLLNFSNDLTLVF